MRAFVAALCASVLALPLVMSSGASGDPIGDKRAEAARIATELDELRHEAEVYAEQYNDAVIKLEGLKTKVGAQRERVTATQKRVKAARKALATYAVSAYTSGTDDELSALLSSTGDTASQRKGYVAAVMGDKDDALDRLNAATSDNRYQLERLGKAKEAAADAQEAVASKREATEAAVAEQSELQDRVQGELARLVAQEQARRRAIAIRKARQAAARAAAAEAAQAARQRAAAQQAAAARAATTTTEAPTTTSESPQRAASSSSSSSSTTSEAPATTSAPAPAPAPQPAPAPAPEPQPAGPPASGGSAAVAAARSVLGVPYKWAGASPSGGFDCSGLVMWAWAQAGKGLPHSSGSQYAMSRKISVSQLQPGDIVAFNSPVSHIGLYIGGGQMIHAPHTGDVVKIASIYSTGTPMAGRL